MLRNDRVTMVSEESNCLEEESILIEITQSFCGKIFKIPFGTLCSLLSQLIQTIDDLLLIYK